MEEAHVNETRGSPLDPERDETSIAHHVIGELPAGRLGPQVGLSLGRLDTLGKVLVHVTLRETIQCLPNDLAALSHLQDANVVTIPTGADGTMFRRPDGDFEVVLLVPAVRFFLPNVPFDTRSPEVGSADGIGNRQLGRNDADRRRAFGENLVEAQQVVHLVYRVPKLIDEIPALLYPSFGQIMRDPSYPIEVVKEPCATKPFKEIEHHFPIAETVQERSEGTDVDTVGSHRKQMAGDPLQLGHQDANGVDPFVDPDPHQFLDGQSVGQAVGHRADVIHAVGEGNDAGVVDVLGVFLEIAVEVADVRARLFDYLTVGQKLHAEYPMGRRMLRPHLEDHLVAGEILLAEGGDVLGPELLFDCRRHNLVLVGSSPTRGARSSLAPNNTAGFPCTVTHEQFLPAGAVQSNGPTPSFSPSLALSTICFPGLTGMP